MTSDPLHSRRGLACLRLAAILLLVTSTVFARSLAAGAASPRPNIVIIYADDIGYGDFGCYGATAVKTPHVDRLAREGLRFTDAHSPAATCTPSRYSLLTGEYAWRKPGTGILPGDAALIIEPGRTTLASMLHAAGYATGVVGKWHLGLGAERGALDWNGEIKPGPLEIGFDYAFIMPATGDRVPCVYVEDHRVVGLDPSDPIAVSYDQPFPGEPIGTNNRSELRMDWSHGHNQAVVNRVGRIGYMKGGAAARWKDETMADEFTRHAVQFIERQQHGPFCLYFATHDIHVPRLPNPRFAGQTTMGPRGDAIVEFDSCVGEIMAVLARLKLADNTLVILSSDNGPVLDDGYKDQAVERLGNHRPSGPLRGGKYSAFEGGTRVPLVVHWPGRVKPGVSAALVSQVDLLASLAALVGQRLGDGDAPDSVNVLAALLGDDTEGRPELVEQGGPTALRSGGWKFIAATRQARARIARDNGVQATDQLYDLTSDLAEKKDLATEQPQRKAQMRARLQEIMGPRGGRP